MPGLRSLRNRLAVVFGLIVLGVVGTIYLSTTPRLQDTMRFRGLLLPRVRNRAAQLGTEILVLRPLKGTPQVLTLVVDSTPDGGVTSLDVLGVAQQALATRRIATGTQPTSIGREALAAHPLAKNRGVVVLSDSLQDVEGNVAL